MSRKCENWLYAYRDFVAESESPEGFHLWCALAAIAGAAQRKIFMRSKYFWVHSNMYVILVSPPGRGKKTTAILTAMGILKQVPGTIFAPDMTSVAAFIEEFVDLKAKPHQSITAASKELGSLMKENELEMLTFLIDIFDGNDDWKKRTRSKGIELITKPWLNLLAGTTTDWMGRNMSAFATGGGFTARCIFVYEDERILKEGWPEEIEGDIEARQDLIHDLRHIAKLEGEFKFASDAKVFYREWYKDEARFPTVDDSRTASYYDRKHIHLLKIAMVLSLAEKDELRLEKYHVEAALNLLDGTEPGMQLAFQTVGKNTRIPDIERIHDQVRHAGKEGVEMKDIIRANIHNCTIEEIHDHLSTLLQLEEIQRNGTRVWSLHEDQGVA